MVDDTTFKDNDLVEYYDELVEYLNVKIGNRQIALDAVQETYLRILQRPEHFLNLVNPIAFLKKVSINIALDSLRKVKNYDKYFEILDTDEFDLLVEYSVLSEQEISVVRQQFTDLILHKINSLPPMCQDVFLLIQFHGMTQVEVAKQLGISRTMVIKHLTRALQTFKSIFIQD